MPMVDIVEFGLPSQDVVVDAVVQSMNCVLLAYTLAQIDMVITTRANRPLTAAYFAYTGSEIGLNRDEGELIDLLQERLGRAIPDMHFYLRSYEHVSTLQCLVRSVQSQHFASERGQAYIPHEFRGRIMNVLAREKSQPAFRIIWEQLMARMTAGIKKEYDEKLDWTRPADNGSFALWERLNMPIFLTMALEQTKGVEDLFFHVREIRDKARPLRELIDQYVHIQDAQQGARVGQEIRAVANELGSVAPAKPSSIFSVSIGLPMSISLGFNLPPANANRSVAFIRDIYDNHAVPLFLVRDFERVFDAGVNQGVLDVLDGVAPSENVLDSFFERAQWPSDRKA